MEKERTKLCPHCEGRVPIASDECPYCGQNIFFDDFSYPQETTSKFIPPYAASASIHLEEPQHKRVETARSEEKEKQKQKSLLLTILFLSVGSCLFTLGLIIFFFSENGKLILEWKSRYSLFYCLIAAPFLYIGWLRLKNE
ncbi:MAG: hypothetical protein HY860_04180 [Chlamydiales bacterium]|nr:hypothetical protein [Chlamydiales bacterium]